MAEIGQEVVLTIGEATVTMKITKIEKDTADKDTERDKEFNNINDNENLTKEIPEVKDNIEPAPGSTSVPSPENIQVSKQQIKDLQYLMSQKELMLWSDDKETRRMNLAPFIKQAYKTNISFKDINGANVDTLLDYMRNLIKKERDGNN